jgi:hypothetical protein
MRLASILTVLVMIAGLVGCDSDGSSPSNDAGPNSFNSDSFALVDAEDAFASFEEGTLDREISMKSVFHHGDGEFFRHHMHPRGPGSHLAPVLFRLGLDMDQLRQLRAIIMEHRGSIREDLEGLREANLELIEKANAERRAIVGAFKAEEITREEAEQQMRDLNERTRAAIRGNPANEEFLQRICDGRLDLFEDIRSMLTGTQVAEWDDWVAGPSNDCINP